MCGNVEHGKEKHNLTHREGVCNSIRETCDSGETAWQEVEKRLVPQELLQHNRARKICNIVRWEGNVLECKSNGVNLQERIAET